MSRPILLVENDPEACERTVHSLAESTIPNPVVALRDGEQALDYLLRKDAYAGRPVDDPVVVLLDLKLSPLDGIQVLERIRAHPALKTIPVVILTASKADDLTEAYKFNVNGVVLKPTDPAEFAQMVRELGVFWGVFNEPPPAPVSTVRRTRPHLCGAGDVAWASCP